MRILIALSLCVTWGSIAGETNELSLRQLTEALQEHVSQPKFEAATWGVHVISLSTGWTLYETNSHKLLKPASNAKLYTGALALDKFGPDYRIRTSLYSHAQPSEDGTLKGDLVVYGRGDFSIAARFNGGSYSNLLAHVVAAIRDAGIKRIDGSLIGDDTYFQGPRMGSSWTWDDLQYYYGAEVSALTIQDNVIDLFLEPGTAIGEPCKLSLKPETAFVRFINRTTTSDTNNRPRIGVHRPIGENHAYLNGQIPQGNGTVEEAATVSNPALWYVTLLREALQDEGIRVMGTLRSKSWPAEPATDVSHLHEIAFVESRPMAEMVEKMMKPSQNLYAQLLLLQVGASSESDAAFTESSGIRELRSFLTRAEINLGEVLLDEGSGLSRSALVSPRATVQLLRFMHNHPHGQVFRATLPGAGVDGTLRSRLKDLSGNLAAKTGTIRYVNCLSGYMTSRAGEPLAFSIMLNAYQSTGSTTPRAELDVIPRFLARLSEKSEPTEAMSEQN